MLIDFQSIKILVESTNKNILLTSHKSVSTLIDTHIDTIVSDFYRFKND